MDSDGQHVCLFDELFQENRPYCGILNKAQKRTLFGNRGLKIASAAIIPLIDSRRLGVMAVGAEEANRFGDRMDTLFLDYLGELVSRSVSVYQHQQNQRF